MTTMLRRILSKAGLGCAALALMSVTGCYGTFHEVVDPCYPERYNCKAREEVNAFRNMQEANGTAIEQTLYAHYFMPGEAKLNDGGIAFLERITHRRPSPETTIYIQTAQNTYDLDFNQNAGQVAQKRTDLDNARKALVEQFVKMSRPDVAFNIVTGANPGKEGINGLEIATGVRNIRRTARGYYLIPGFQETGSTGGSGGGSQE
jgi:hypothetical protein